MESAEPFADALTTFNTRPPTRQRLDRWISTTMKGLCGGFAIAVLVLLALVIGFLVSRGYESINWAFFTTAPTGDPTNPGGMLHAIIGSCVLVTLAAIVGVPIGMAAGVYLSEYDVGSRLASPVRFISDVLAGVPSIVVGILGYELFVRPIGNYNAWAGALALAFIMIPIVCRTTEEMLRLVPGSYREASIALGATKARTILNVVIPSATGSIVTGIMLALARIAGETAPLIFTAAGSRLIPFYTDPQRGFEISAAGDLNRAFPSLTKQVYDYAVGPYTEQKKVAMAGILVLIVLIFCVNVTIRLVARRRPRG